MGAPSSPVTVAAVGEAGDAARPRFEVADVVRAYGTQYVRTHPTSSEQRRVLRAIAACRTAALGGHVEGGDACGHRRIAYNSCRNRHCPKCQGTETARWMAGEQALLLPVPYFHVVFTLPHALNPLVRVNRRRLCALVFHAAAATLRTFARDPRHLGAEPAITMVVHTWAQTLIEHFHVHCVVSGGGLALDGGAWVGLPPGKRKPRRPFLFPVKALSAVFRGKYLAALTRARQRGELLFAGHSAPLADPLPWAQLLDSLGRTDWVVYCKRPFAGPAPVLKHLSRYTHRVAIANRRIVFVGDGVVRFTYRDSAHREQRTEMTLPATEFLRRFLLHVVPSGFMRIRHYGLTANRHRQRKLPRARELLSVGQLSATNTDAATPTTAADTTSTSTDSPIKICPRCGAPLHIVEIIPATRDDLLAPTAAPPDTS